MLSSGVRLGLTVGAPAAAAMLAYLLPRRAADAARGIALLLSAISLGLLASEASLISQGARLTAAFGTLGGIRVLLRADPQGMIIGIVAVVAAALRLLARDMSPLHIAAVMLCTTGALTAALGGDTVMLFAGMELANAGATLLLLTGGRRAGRVVWTTLVVQQAAALALLTAALELQGATGTSDFSVLPAAAVGGGTAMLWIVSGAARLAAPALAPGGRQRLLAAWGATGAVPVAAVVLLRLRAAVSGAMPTAATAFSLGLGACLAVAAAILALRNRHDPFRAGRSLLLLQAALALSLTGASGAAAATGVAAGMVALELSVAAAPLWERPPSGHPRWLAAGALLSAGSLPVGAGATAALLELSAVTALGRPLSLLVVPLGGAVIAGAAAAGAASMRAVTAEPRRRGPVSPLPVTALLAGAAAAVLPGLAASGLIDSLAAGGVARSSGAATVLSPGGGWAGGYFGVAALVLGVMAVSGLELTGLRVPGRDPEQLEARSILLLPLRPLVGLRLRMRQAAAALDRVDGWLALQPQLPMVVVVAVGALLLVH
jgi:hypothetical protein